MLVVFENVCCLILCLLLGVFFDLLRLLFACFFFGVSDWLFSYPRVVQVWFVVGASLRTFGGLFFSWLSGLLSFGDAVKVPVCRSVVCFGVVLQRGESFSRGASCVLSSFWYFFASACGVGHSFVVFFFWSMCFGVAFFVVSEEYCIFVVFGFFCICVAFLGSCATISSRGIF